MIKNTLAIATAAVFAAGGAMAQATTTQAGVIGASDDATYSLQVQGANGVIYNCLPNPTTING